MTDFLTRLQQAVARRLGALRMSPGASAADVAFGPVRKDALGTGYRPFRTFSADGLALAGRDYGAADDTRPALYCLAGLSRNSRDFEPVARHFARSGRRVVTLDSRGRGLSDHDPNPVNYNPLIEAQDALLVMDRLRFARPVLLGTSRGGLLAMTMAGLRPLPFSAVILNDIGPVIEIAGLLKITSYLGKTAPPANWPAATDWMEGLLKPTFPALDRAAFERMARRIFREWGGMLLPDYDPKLALGSEFLTPATIMPQLWAQFALFQPIPVMVIHGEHSDILSSITVETMTRRHPALTVATVPGEGHAPILADAATLTAMTAFLETADASAAQLGAMAPAD